MIDAQLWLRLLQPLVATYRRIRQNQFAELREDLRHRDERVDRRVDAGAREPQVHEVLHRLRTVDDPARRNPVPQEQSGDERGLGDKWGID